MRSSGFGCVSTAIRNWRVARDGAASLADLPELNSRNPSRWQTLLRATSVSIAVVAASVAFAATTTVSVLMDTDNNAVSGCSISTVNGAFVGVEKVLNTVVVTDPAGYRIQSINLQVCAGGTLTAPGVIDASSTPLARGNGSNGTTAVETYLPNIYLPANGTKMRVGITTLGADGLTGADALTLAGTGPILVDGAPLIIVPTLGKLSLALTALLLALSVWFARRRGWHGMQLVVVAAFALSMSGQLIAAIVRDGFIGDWTGIAPAAIDPAGDAPVGVDITNFYSTVDNGNVYFRIDTTLNAPPVANAQSVVAVANIALPITLTGSDYEASPLTFTVVTQPVHGTLTGAAPNLTYTASSTYGGPDSFTFRANDGVLNSADATVTIDVKLPPTITSLNSATFIPGQANSFNFTATGAPGATFTLSACNVALPPSISVTNNSNNTATLAGNPTVAQGGTYVCTLTASNGFGSNATQAFTLNLGLPPTFTSANATTFTVATAGSFAVTTTATPATTGITQTGALPAGVTFVYNGPGTPLNGTLAGTPAAGTGGTYPITLTAANGIAPNTAQNFTLTVNQTPAITSVNNTNCVIGVVCTFTVTASGFPVPAIARSGASLPSGMNYVDNGNGTGTLSGTPALGTANVYALTFTPGNGVGAPTAQAFTLTVTKASQTISFTSLAPTAASVGGATYTVTATATSALVPAFSIDASAAAVCSITGATVSFIGVGTCVINANQAGNADFSAAPQVQQSFVVVKGNQTIAFTSTAPAAAKVAGPTYTVVATASPSGLPVALSIDASAAAVCSISGATVSFLTVGTCVINANQPGSASYNAAPQVQQSFAVAKGDQTIAFTSTAPVAAKVGGATYTVTATASPSALPVTFAVDASAALVCSISGASVSFVTVGICVINANQAGNTNYNAAPQVQQSFAVAKGDQTISYTSTAPAGATVGGSTYAVTATATSGLAVAFTVDASATSVCSIAGSTVSFVGAGTCVINANQSGNANFNAASQVQQSFAVSKANQSISYTSTTPAGATVGGPTYTVTATATSGLAVAFTIDASATSVCSISGATVSFVGAGTCVINANQSGNANFNAAPQAQQSFAVGKASQTISYTSTAPVAATVGGITYTVAATATSSLAVALTIDASATSVCSMSGSTVSFIGVGTCVINANQSGNATFNAAPQVQQSFAVSKANQTISYTSAAPAGAAVSGPTYTVTATASSGLTVVFAIDASASTVCLIAGATVSFIGAGTCVINANQSGNAGFNAAPQVQQSFAVAKANQTISYTSTAPAAATVGGANYTVAATATSGLAVAFAIDATATSVCSIAGATVSFIGNGACVINANQPGNANFNAAPQVQQSFAVKSTQAISFTSTAPPTATVSGASYTVTATATSGLAVTFTIDASASTVCSVAGSTVSFGPSGGTCVINANQAGNASFYPAPQVQQSFAVKQAQSISFTSAAPSAAVYQGATYTVTATATSALPVAFTIDAAASSVCAIAGSTVSFTGTGNCVINANQAGNGVFYPAPQVQQSFTVGPNLAGDSYSVVGNTQLVAASHSTPTAPFTANASTILANDTANVAITLTTVTNAATTAGGLITINAAGAFTYAPPVGQSSGTDTYVYTGTANGVSRTATITFNIANIVWYVDNASVGTHDGRSNSPFLNMGSGAGNLGSALANAGPAIGANIYVFKGTGSTGGAFTLKSSQTLTGAASGLTVGGLSIAGNGANRPTLSGTLSATSGASGITVTGVSFSTGVLAAVDLTNASADFIGGAMAITTTSGQGFKASGGGTVTVQGTGNTISTTTGTALTVSGTSIGAAGLNYQSVSSAAGAANGIVLISTGALGGLVVDGDGSNTAVGGNGSGGSIAGASGADAAVAGNGIYLENTSNVILRRMNVTGTHQNHGIRGIKVNNFVLEYATVIGVHGTNYNSAPNNAGEGSIYFGNYDDANINVNGLTGIGTFTKNLISGGQWNNVSITNRAGTGNLTFKGNTLGANLNNGQGNHSLAIEARNAGTTINVVVGGTAAGEPNTFTSARANHANFTGQTGTTMDVQFKNNVLSNIHPGNNIGGGNLTLASQGVMTYNVDSNTMRDANGSAVTLFKASAGTLHSGRFTNNTIGVAAVANSGSSGSGNGIYVSAAGTGAIQATINNNAIHQISGNAHIYADNTGGNYSADFTIEGNTFDTPGAGNFTGIAITNGSPGSGDTVNACAKIGGTGALKNAVNTGANPAVYLGASGSGASHTFRLPGLVAAPSAAPVQAFVNSNNTLTTGSSVYTDAPATFAAFTGTGTTCNTP